MTKDLTRTLHDTYKVRTKRAAGGKRELSFVRTVLTGIMRMMGQPGKASIFFACMTQCRRMYAHIHARTHDTYTCIRGEPTQLEAVLAIV